MRINGRRLTPEEFHDFVEALRDAFNPNDFKTMLRERMGWQGILDRNVDGNFFTQMLDKAENDEETLELLEATLREKPRSSLLKKFAQLVGVSLRSEQPTTTTSVSLSSTSSSTQSSTEPSIDPLERKVSELHSSLEPAPWRALMEKRERQICRIIIQGWEKSYGTGFLVNEDVVMTNYHVLQDVIDGSIPPSRVSLHFDYKLKEDGKTLDTSTDHWLADNWLLDHCEHSHLDRQSTEHCVDVNERHLDYALLHLKTKASEDLVDGVRRGWINIPEIEYAFKLDTALLILHHPNGGTLTFDLDTRSVMETNPNKTRVRYTTNTSYGSSGAPCFNANWELVAIHQSGDPDFSHSARYNQGIPIATILHRLKKQGKAGYLGDGQEKKTVKDPLYLVSRFAAPECKMSIEGQKQLYLLLGKQNLGTSNPSNSIPIKVTKDMLARIDSEQLSYHLYFLFGQYMQVTSLLMESAREPFNGSADLLPAHFTHASGQLDLVEECLRKICTLSKSAVQLLNSSLVTQITVEADSIIGEKGKFCQFLDEEKGEFYQYLKEEKKKERVGYSQRIKRDIKSKFSVFMRRLDEFQQKLPVS